MQAFSVWIATLLIVGGCAFSGVAVAAAAATPGVCDLDAAHDLHRSGEHRAAIEAFECALPLVEAGHAPLSLGNRMTYARSLKKVGDFRRALGELNRVESIVASDAALAARTELRAALLTAKASVHACSNLERAVTVGQESLSLAVAMLRSEPTSAPLIEATMRRMLDLAKWYNWLGWATESNRMLSSAARLFASTARGAGTQPRQRWGLRLDAVESLQYPGVELVRGLPRSAWTWSYASSNRRGAAGGAGDAAKGVVAAARRRDAGGAAESAAESAAAAWRTHWGLAPIADALVDAAPALRAEYIALARAGRLKRQAECLDDPGRGAWRYLSAFASGRDVARRAACDAAALPAACALVATLTAALAQLGSAGSGRGGSSRLVRVGYSVLDAGGRIRPHCGATNAQLKLHLGLVVPQGGACTSLRVGRTVLRPGWREGEVTGLDDSFEHEVWNNCTEARAIVQIVVTHPALAGKSAKGRSSRLLSSAPLPKE